MHRIIKVLLASAVLLATFLGGETMLAFADSPARESGDVIVETDDYAECDFVCCSLVERAGESRITYLKYCGTDKTTKSSREVRPQIELPDNPLEIVPSDQLDQSPWSAILCLSDANQSSFRGSGFLVGDSIAYTAAHCVTWNNAFRTGLRASVSVQNFLNLGTSVSASEIIVPKAWLDSYNPDVESLAGRYDWNYDYAIVKFQKTFDVTPFFYGSISIGDFPQMAVNCAGYSGELEGASRLYVTYLYSNDHDVDLSESVGIGENMFSMPLSMKVGMSGGPVFTKAGNSYVAVGIISWEASYYNAACAIPESLGDLVRWLEPSGGGSPSTGVDDLSEEEIAELIEDQKAVQPTRKKEVIPALKRAMELNPEIAAWLYVPGTNVTLPVARHEGADDFYLEHGADGADSPLGCAYMEGVDSVAFDQPLTVLYAHSFPNLDLMFTQLHRFTDPGFFDRHESFYIVTPDAIYTYRVLEAALYNSCHISSDIDEQDTNALQRYFDRFRTDRPDATMRNWRSTEVDASSDKIVQLSTCTIPALDNARFIVSGVLSEERRL